MINIDKSKVSQTRHSLSPNRSSMSMISRNKDKKNSSLTTSTPKLQRSIDTQPRLSTRTNFKLPNQQYNNEKMPFSESESTHQTSILTNEK
jgi:hypothetical protein